MPIIEVEHLHKRYWDTVAVYEEVAVAELGRLADGDQQTLEQGQPHLMGPADPAWPRAAGPSSSWPGSATRIRRHS